MKKVFLITTLLIFGMSGPLATMSGGNVVFAQKKDKDEKKKDSPGPPVIKDKGIPKQKEPPPKKDKRP